MIAIPLSDGFELHDESVGLCNTDIVEQCTYLIRTYKQGREGSSG